MELTIGRRKYFEYQFEETMRCKEYWRGKYRETQTSQSRIIYRQCLRSLRGLKQLLDKNMEPK